VKGKVTSTGRFNAGRERERERGCFESRIIKSPLLLNYVKM